MGKLTLLHINIIGIVMGLLLILILWFAMIKPKNEEVETTKASAESTKQAGGTDEKIKEKDRELANVKKDAVKTRADWAVNDQKYMPALPYTAKTNDVDLYFFPPVGKSSKGQLFGFRDIPTVWGQWVTAWYDAQRNQGVTRLPGTEFPIAEFAPDPNQLTGALKDHLTFPSAGKTWPVALQCKSFDEAVAHLKRFNGMERHGMPVIDDATIAGQSPNLTLAYSLAMYVIPRTAPPVPDPMLNGSASGASAPSGGFGGFGGPMGPPAGMGGPPVGMPGVPGGAPIPGGARGGKGASTD